MKVDKLGKKIINVAMKPNFENSKPVQTAVEKVNASASECVCAYSKAAINIEDKLKNIKSKAEEIFSKWIDKEDNIWGSRLYGEDNVLRFKIGKEIQGLKGLYKDEKCASCYINSEGQITYALLKNNKDGSVKFLDLINGVTHDYSAQDIKALHYYKYHPDAIHAKLRYGKDCYGGDMKEEMLKVIEDLSQLFADKSKVIRNAKKCTLYRALQSRLSEQDIDKLQSVGEIFAEKSFCSTTTDLNAAKRFAHGNPILEIEFPKGGEYIDIEKIFNIDRCHWREAEYLLDKGSKFKIKGFDNVNNIIKAEYII
jgi:hypothetical protein